MGFNQRLKQAMADKSITMYRLAKELGVHQTTIKNWLDGKGEPHLGQVQQIAQILDADVVYLISGQTTEEVQQGIITDADTEIRAILENLQEKPKSKVFDERIALRNTIIHVFKLLDGLNATGQKKAIERLEELAEIPRYRRQDNPDSDAPKEET